MKKNLKFKKDDDVWVVNRSGSIRSASVVSLFEKDGNGVSHYFVKNKNYDKNTYIADEWSMFRRPSEKRLVIEYMDRKILHLMKERDDFDNSILLT